MAMKGIACCADCGNYSTKKHKCLRGCKERGKPTDRFYVDCPLPDVRPVKRGKWEKRHVHRGGFRRHTGIDDRGEEHTITVDERVEYDDLYCSLCGKISPDTFTNYCPNCGAKMDGGDK